MQFMNQKIFLNCILHGYTRTSPCLLFSVYKGRSIGLLC